MAHEEKTEWFLRGEQFVFRFEHRVPLSKIDIAGARINPARLDRKVDKKRVEAMALDMIAAGTTDGFPALLLLDNGPDLFELVTGLHRTESAFVAEIDYFDCYIIIEPTAYRRMLLPRLANIREGQAPTEEDKLQLMQQVLAEHPHARVEDLAKLFLLKEKTVRGFLAIEKVAQRCVALGVKEAYRTDIAPKGERAIMAFAKVQNNVLFVEAIRIVSSYRCSVAEVQAVARRAEDARSEKLGMQALAECEDDLIERDREREALTKGRSSLATPTKFRRFVTAQVNMGAAKKLGLDAFPERAVPGLIILLEQQQEQTCEALAILRHREEIAQRLRDRAKPGERPSPSVSPTA